MTIRAYIKGELYFFKCHEDMLWCLKHEHDVDLGEAMPSDPETIKSCIGTAVNALDHMNYAGGIDKSESTVKKAIELIKEEKRMSKANKQRLIDLLDQALDDMADDLEEHVEGYRVEAMEALDEIRNL